MSSQKDDERKLICPKLAVKQACKGTKIVSSSWLGRLKADFGDLKLAQHTAGFLD